MARARKPYIPTPEETAMLARIAAEVAMYNALSVDDLLALGFAFWRGGEGLADCSPAAQVVWDMAGGYEGLLRTHRSRLYSALCAHRHGPQSSMVIRVLGYIGEQPTRMPNA